MIHSVRKIAVSGKTGVEGGGGHGGMKGQEEGRGG